MTVCHSNLSQAFDPDSLLSRSWGSTWWVDFRSLAAACCDEGLREKPRLLSRVLRQFSILKSWVSRQLLFAGSSWPKAQYSSIQLNTDWFTRRFGLWCLRSNATQRFGSVDAGGQSTLPTWCCIGEFLACKLRCLRLAKFDQKQVVYLSFGSKFEVDGPNPSCSELFSPLCKCKFFPSSKLHYSPCFVDFKAQADGPPWQLQETFHQPQRRAQGHPPGFSKTGNLCLYPKPDLGVVKSVRCDKNVRRWADLWISLLHLFLLCSSLLYRLRLTEARNCQTASSSGWTWFWDLLLKCPRSWL